MAGPNHLKQTELSSTATVLIEAFGQWVNTTTDWRKVQDGLYLCADPKLEGQMAILRMERVCCNLENNAFDKADSPTVLDNTPQRSVCQNPEAHFVWKGRHAIHKDGVGELYTASPRPISNHLRTCCAHRLRNYLRGAGHAISTDGRSHTHFPKRGGMD
ncbi:uncharacterized protein BDZ99DRAFT_82608 [Mytilinidion resinicola]|uniref:Uncharacterized protein n=1 Tax=Mytilinidion resinicola TaxID=574789 RepID=A0A6A6YCW0_9PEZI|nr:uncharacterized protein BDZ99DRAFT_82608 [Mytilinidion resinicola]KAF2806652.1 hypothetical protein BDZ99DRAFT_82608 [Mytilinidion resinicola]